METDSDPIAPQDRNSATQQVQKSATQQVQEGLSRFRDIVSDFFGINDIDDKAKERYRCRREKLYQTDLKERGDEVDARQCVGRKKCRPRKRESLYTIVRKATAKEKYGKLKPDEKKRSFAPADLEKVPQPRFDEFEKELFYNEVQKQKGADEKVMRDKMEEANGESHMDMAIVRPRDEEEDEIDFGPGVPLTMIKPGSDKTRADKPRMLSRMTKEMSREIPRNKELNKKREAVFDQLCDSARDFFCCKICKWKKTESSRDKRPYFSFFVTFVQVVIMITAVSVYGFAKPHYSKVEETDLVLKPSLSIELTRRSEFGNIWLGPRQDDLIHLGAKYSPCMRKDPNLAMVLELDRQEEMLSGCCVRDDGAGCVQTLASYCSNFISTFVKWNRTYTSSQGFTSGAVCGQDPKYCKKPYSRTPFEWNKNDITEWPLCEETSKPGFSGSGIVDQPDRHMSCELLGRPCCHGIQGECMITTREHCDFLRGYYHDEAFLCSQVNCFEEVCGMIPFVVEDKPDQFSRVWSANLLHAGFFHLLISFMFQMIVMVRLEQVYGSLRIMFIYVGSGTIGTLASCVLLPYHVETGPAGAHFGILACMYVDILYNILNNWQNNQSNQNHDLKTNLAIYSLVLLILFVLGLLPWLDNWAHIFGFVSGALLSLVLIKEIRLDKKGLTKLRVIIISLIIFVVMFILLMIGFYVVPPTKGSWVQYLNCIPFDDTFCQNMDVSITRGSSYTSHL